MNDQPEPRANPVSAAKETTVSVWALIGLTLRYNRRMILTSYGTALLLAALIQAVVILVDRQQETVFLLMAAVLFVSASMFIGITVNANEVSERRLRLLLVLPIRRRTVGWARFLTPLLIQLAGFVGGLLILAIQHLAGIESILPRPERALIYIAGLTGFYLFVPMLFPDLGSLWRDGRKRLVVVLAVVMGCCVAALGWLQISGGWKIPSMIYFTPLPAVFLAVLSLWVFFRRASYAR